LIKGSADHREKREEREKERERENEGDVPWQIFFCVVVVCLGLAPFLSGLLFSLGETQIWLGDLRVVVVVGPGCFLVDFNLPAFMDRTNCVRIQMSF
jgi:hypothetical protein